MKLTITVCCSNLVLWLCQQRIAIWSTFLIWSILQHECQTRATRVRHERHKYGTIVTRGTQVRYEGDSSGECDTNSTIAARVKTYFHTLTLGIWQMKDCRESTNFTLRTTFWKCLIPMPKCVWKDHHDNWTF